MQNAPLEAQTRIDPAGVIVAVIVTMNRHDQIRTTLDRLLASPVNQIVVVDNGSTDGTRDWLRGLDTARVLVDLPERNLGGAGGFARGMALARERFDPDWMLLSDDDSRPWPRAIEKFRQMDLDGWDAVAGAVYYPGGTICEMNRPSRNPFWSLPVFAKTLTSLGRDGFHVPNSAFKAGQMTEVDVGSFVGFFVSREGVRRAGLPDGRMFIYGDDVLYSLQLRKAGGRIGFSADVGFEHDCGTRSSHDGTRVQPIWKVYYLIRNKIVVYRTVAGPLFWVMLPGLLARWRLRSRNYGRHSDAYLRLMSAAIRDGLKRDFGRDHDAIIEMGRD